MYAQQIYYFGPSTLYSLTAWNLTVWTPTCTFWPCGTHKMIEFNHSYCYPSYDRFIDFPKCILHRVWFSISSFSFQYPHFSSRPSSSSLLLLPHLSITPSLPCLSFNTVFYRAVPMHDVTNPVSFPSIVCRIFLSSLALSKTSYFSHVSSIFPQHHTSKFSRYFWSTFCSVQVSPPYKLYSKCSNLLVSYLNLSIICWQRAFFTLNSVFAVAWHDWVKHDKFIKLHYSVR